MNLNLCDDDPPGLLVEPLVVPVRVEVGEVAGEPVVLPHPHRVVHSQPGLLVTAAVPRHEALPPLGLLQPPGDLALLPALRTLLLRQQTLAVAVCPG